MSEPASTSSSPVEPRPAATVMLVRDSATGVEVFLMQRSAHGMFAGLHVFPGGKVDRSDHHAERWEAYARGPDDVAASATLGLDSGGLGYWVACIRECFEEAGILLALGADGDTLRLHSPRVRTRFESWRTRLNDGEPNVFEAMCNEEKLRLATDQLAYVSHWITPIDQPRRYNTRFFVARAPARQEALHDGHETVESSWIRPEDALEKFRAGKLNLISPTFKNLEAIADYPTTEELLQAKRTIDPATIPTILPRIISRESETFEEILDVVGHGGRLSA
ncbi:MAG: NUDIX domain-containing protein [Proteobacteria bacterium]|nr:NUDIX domain-containing protein [Pseudomonadota bacterium]